MLIDEIAKQILDKINKKKAAHHELLFLFYTTYCFIFQSSSQNLLLI